MSTEPNDALPPASFARQMYVHLRSLHNDMWNLALKIAAMEDALAGVADRAGELAEAKALLTDLVEKHAILMQSWRAAVRTVGTQIGPDEVFREDWLAAFGEEQDQHREVSPREPGGEPLPGEEP